MTSTHTRGPGDAPWSGAIDVHHHAIPGFYVEELRKLGHLSALPGVDRPEWSVQSSLAMMDRAGIRAAVLNVWPGVPAGGGTVAAGLARRVNEYLATLAAQHPGRIGGFAVLPLPDVDAALDELAYSADVLGLDGVGLVTHYGGVYTGDPSFDPLLAEAALRGTPLFVHPTAPPSRGQPSFGLPASLCEFPFETVRLAAQLLYHGALERHPGLRMILSHGGGGLAYYAARLATGPLISPELAERLPANPIGRLRGLYCDTAMIGDACAFGPVRAFSGPGRMLVGSDYPFMPEPFITDNGRFIAEHGGLAPAELARVTSGNAAALFPRLGRTRTEAR